MKTKEDVLEACVVDGNIVRLPDWTLDRKLYLEVAKSLELIGGSWKSGKTKGFVFNNDPTDLLKKLNSSGSSDFKQESKINLKKEFQFFATPADLADELVGYADIKDGMMILEPEAGQGAIVEAIYRAFPRYMKGPT